MSLVRLIKQEAKTEKSITLLDIHRKHVECYRNGDC